MTETTKDLIARLMQHVEDTMCEADVDYPAGYEAGANVSYDSDFLQTCFETELTAALAREAALRDALEPFADRAAPDLYRVATEQAAEIERLKKLLGSGLAKVEADETLFVWAVEARAALGVKP